MIDQLSFWTFCTLSGLVYFRLKPIPVEKRQSARNSSDDIASWVDAVRSAKLPPVMPHTNRPKNRSEPVTDHFANIFRGFTSYTPKEKDFYQSKVWSKLRKVIFKRDGRICALCKSTERLHIDHIFPRSKFPHLSLDPNNMQVLCRDCNIEKSNFNSCDFRKRY
jgi:hypothetical protein